jgi:hypothetical protein
MKQLIVILLYLLFGITLACSEKKDNAMQNTPYTLKLTSEYLLAHGFKHSDDPNTPDIYELEKIRLGDVARDLGFSITALKTTAGQNADEDVRTVIIDNIYIIIQNKLEKESEEWKSGKWVFGGSHALDNPKSICKATVILNYKRNKSD